VSTRHDRRDSRRRVLRWSLLPYAVLAAGIVVLAAVLYLIIVDLERDNRRIQAEYRDNLVWVAGQFERELSAFIAAFNSYYLDEPSMTRDELIDRFDVFWSRVESADKGAVGKIYMGFEGVAPLIEKTKRLLREIEPIVMTMQPGDTVSHRLIKARLEDLPASFHDVALLAFHGQMRDMTAMHRRTEEAHGKLLAIFAGVLAGGAILIGLILLEMRQVNALRASLERRVEERTRDLRQEIVERQRAAEALRDSEDRLRRSVLDAPIPIMMHAEGGEVLMISKRWTELSGYSHADIPNILDWTEKAYGADREHMRDLIGGLYEIEEPFEDEAYVTTASGERRTWDFRTAPLGRLPDGRRFVISMVVDVTERRMAHDELERRVEERTAELSAAQANLLRQERLATLGQLTATVSHELRNPLGVIQTSTCVVRDNLKDCDPRVGRSLERIERSVIRCDRIIEELLDYTRIRQLEPEPTPIDTWLEGVLEEQTLHTDITLRRELGLAGVKVFLDHDRFRRAVINVFDNACQAMVGDGNGKIEDGGHILTIQTGKTNGRIEVVFEDNGPGIPPDVLPKIFEPMFSTKGFGVGLGLPVAKQIMEQHGGGIEIDSGQGRGTRTCLWLPSDHAVH
jgi:PAS domain S-box-containing protein